MFLKPLEASSSSLVDSTAAHSHAGLFTMEPLLFVVDGSCGVLNCNDSALLAFSCVRGNIIGSDFRSLLVELCSEWESVLPLQSLQLLAAGYFLPWGASGSNGLGWNVSSVAIDPDSSDMTSVVFVPGMAPDMMTRASEEGLSGSVGGALRELFHRAKQADARYRSFLRLLPGVSFVQRVDLSFSYRSSELRTLLGGRDFDLLKTCNWVDWVYPDEREFFNQEIERCRSSQRPVNFRFRLKLPLRNKTLHLMEIRFPVRSVDGVLCGFEGLWLDLTPQKIAEKRLQESAWKESLNEVSGSLTHDFNNILTGIINLADLMRPDYEESRNDGSASNLDLIWESAKRAKDIVQRIVTLNRTQSGTIELLELSSVLKYEFDLIRIVLPQRIRLSLTLPEQELPVRVDKVVICRILLNFATNARDAIKNKGDVTIAVRLVDLKEYQRDHLFSSLCPFRGRGVELVFSDTGQGIDPQNIDRIFCPYYSTKSQGSGTGLGLSSLSRYAMDNGFDFGVRSVEGIGTDLLLLLPLECSDFEVSSASPVAIAQAEPFRPAYDAALRVCIGGQSTFARDIQLIQNCFEQDYGLEARVITEGSVADDWLEAGEVGGVEQCVVFVVRADNSASLSVELRESLLLGRGCSCRIAIVTDSAAVQSQAMRGELFDELIDTVGDIEIDVRAVLRFLRHSSLFALKDFSMILD